MIEVLCTTCALQFRGMDTFRSHCAEVHPQDVEGMGEIAALASANLVALEEKR